MLGLALSVASGAWPGVSRAAASVADSVDPEALSIQGVTLRKRERSLALSFRASGKDWHKLEDRIRSGLPLTLTFDIRLDRHRPLFVDRRMSAWKVSHTIRYDSLKDVFVVTRSASEEEASAGPSRAVKDFERAIAAESSVRNFRVPLAPSRPPARYALRMRVRAEPVRGKEVPRYLRLLNPVFDPTFGIGPPTSDWYVQEFEF